MPSRDDCAEGYVTELPYTLGYYPELNPRRARDTLVEAGIAVAPIRRACELGFGRGLSLAIHAVAGDVEWWGNDLLPRHVEEVETLTRGLSSRIHVTGEPFAEFCAREDLPTFDFIAMHGVWSWISPNNRDVIKDFIDRKLAVGGVLYLSYNVRQAWASVVSLREFLVAEASRPELAAKSLPDRIETALVAAQQVVAADLPPARDNPAFEKHLRKIRYQAKAYLAHEYFNRDWTLFDETDIAATFEPLGLRYGAQAKASAKDSGFRRDLWVRERALHASRAPRVSDSVENPFVADGDSVDALNARLLQRALDEPYLSTLASAQTGGGVELGWRTLLALGARRAGARDAPSIAASVAATLARLGHPLVHEGVVIKDSEEFAAILRREATAVLKTFVPAVDVVHVNRPAPKDLQSAPR